MEEKKIKHLDLISVTINRMASNSLAIKGLLITIIAAILALKIDEIEIKLFILIMGVIIIFIIFDCYYLLLEKKFRKLYDDIRIQNEDDIDFNMDIKHIKLNQFKMFLSPSIYLFYIPISVIVLIISLICE